MSPTIFRAGGLRFFFFSREALRLVEEHEDEIRAAWREHFGS